MAANPQQSPALSARSSKKNVYEVNAKLFKTLERTFQDATPANYEKFQSDTRKLAKYLSDSRGYYESARPEIVKLIATVHRSLSRVQGVDSLSMVPSEVLQTHPIGVCLAQLMAAIRAHVHLFVDQGQRAFINSSLRLVGLEPLLTPGASSTRVAAPSRHSSHDATPTLSSPTIPTVQQFPAPRPLSSGSISVPASMADSARTHLSQATNVGHQPVLAAAKEAPVTMPSRPQEKPLVSRNQTPQINRPPPFATSSSAGLAISPSIPATVVGTTQNTAQPASTALATPVSGAQSPTVTQLPPSRSGSLSQSTSISASSGPRPRKKKKTLDFAHLFQIDIAGTQKRQGSVSTPPNSAPPVTVKKEELTTALSEQKVQNTVPSPVAQVPRAASATPGAITVDPVSVLEQAKSSETRTASAGAPAQASDASEVQVVYHIVPSASPSVGPPAQELGVKTEEVCLTPLRLAESPQPLPAAHASTEPVDIPDVSIHQQPLLELDKPALSAQAPTLEGVISEAAPPDNRPEGRSGVPLPEKERSASLVRQDEKAMDIDLPPATIPPPPAVSQLQAPAMTRIVSTASTSVSMDLESISDYQVPQAANDRSSMPTSGLAPDSLQEQTRPLPQGDTNQTIAGGALPEIEDAMDLDQLTAPPPIQSPSPAPSDGLFEDDLRPVSYKAGTSPGTRVVLDFHLSVEDANLAQRWWSQTGTPSEIRKETLCLSLGCYPAEQVNYSQPLKPQIRSKPSQWPQGGGLGISFDTSAQSMTLPLAPPFTVTPENTFDVSSLAKAGHNAFEIVQSKDWSQHVFALFLHRPTRSQVDKIKKKRKADEDWEKWKAEMAQPLALNIPKPPWVLSAS